MPETHRESKALETLLGHYKHYISAHLTYVESDINRPKFRNAVQNSQFLLVPGRPNSGTGGKIYYDFSCYQGPEFNPNVKPSNVVGKNALEEIIHFARANEIEVVVVPTWIPEEKRGGEVFKPEYMAYRVYSVNKLPNFEALPAALADGEIVRIVAEPTRTALAAPSVLDKGNGDGVIDAAFEEQ